MLIYILLVLMTLAAILVVVCKDILHAVISLAFLSVFTSILFYTLGSPYASMLELSIGAGLITILFLVAISLVEQHRAGHKFTNVNFFALLVVAITALWLGASLVKGGVPNLLAAVSSKNLPETLWGDRLLDVFGLAVVIFTAAIGIGTLFRTEGGK